MVAAQDTILASIKRWESKIEGNFLERPLFTKECRQALFAMGLEKSQGWDEIIVELFKEFWHDLSDPITAIAKKSFSKGRMKQVISKGLIKPIPKQLSSYLLKH